MTDTPSRIPSVFDLAFLTGVEPVTTLILVRHGQQHIPDPRSGPVGDVIDPPLSEIGERQAELVGQRFADQHIDMVYASNLRRALETGRQIARHHDLEPVVLEDLREVEIFRDIPPEMNAVEFIGRDLMLGVRERMIAEKRWDVYPHSESSFAFRKRTVNAIEAIAATNEGKRVVIACHGGVINSYVAHHLGIDYDMFFRPAHTAVNVVFAGHHGVRAVQSLGDVHHLTTDLITY
jgi:2,3-bisphosphoglycerate-dependent phosphoglycerate mutase